MNISTLYLHNAQYHQVGYS
uniref:Uncharacterized protein n=1 Tax=Anguilla anguilla TaxID=7936 RepID=A0A0E9RZW5_ANGAN